MFDAGALVARMVLDRRDWAQGVQAVQKSVEDMQDKVVRMGRIADRAVANLAAGFVGLGLTIKRAGSEMSKFGANIAFFGGAAMAPLILAFNSMKNISPQVAGQLERLKNVMQTFQLDLATAMLPVVERFVNILGGLLRAWMALDPALRQQIVQWTLIAGAIAVVGGTALVAAGKLMTLAGSMLKLIGSVIGFLGPWGMLAVAIVGVIGYFVGFDNVARAVLSAIEVAIYTVITAVLQLGNWMLQVFESSTFALQKFYELLGKLPGKFGEPYRNAAKSVEEFRTSLKGMIDTNNQAIDKLNQKSQQAFGGQGMLAQGLDATIDKLGEMKAWFESLGNTKIDFTPVISSFSLIREGWQQTAQAMASSFSDIFYDGLTGQLKSLKEYFAQFGRVVLRIITDVLAKLLLARLFGSIGGPIGTAFAGLAGHADGIDEVKHSGVYRLHAGEEVRPKADSGKNGGQTIEIHNLITSEAIAAAMSSRPGRNTIVNVIRADANNRGPIKHTIKEG